MALRNNPNQGRHQVRINFQPPRGRQGQNPAPPPPPIIVKYTDIHHASLLRLRRFIENCFRENKIDSLLNEQATFDHLGEHISDTINGETLLSFCIYSELNFKYEDDNIKYILGAERPAEKQPGNCPPEEPLPPDEKEWPVRLLVAKHLIEQGVQINKLSELTGSSCVHTAGTRGDLAFLQLLNKYGMEANRRSNEGHLPSSLAYNYKHVKCADYLDGKSLNLNCLCRAVIRRNLGREPEKLIRFLPIGKSIKIFLEYENPYPGFVMSIVPERPFTAQALLEEEIPCEKILEFIQKNAHPIFLKCHKLEEASYQYAVQVYNELFRMQEFREEEYVENVVTSRYISLDNSSVDN